MKKRSEETQTLRAGCSKAEPRKIAPLQTPFPGARDGQNLTSCRWSLSLPTNPVWWGWMHAISSYRGNRPTHIQAHTNRHDRLQYTAPQLASAQCNYSVTVEGLEFHVCHSLSGLVVFIFRFWPKICCIFVFVSAKTYRIFGGFSASQ